MLVQLCLGLLTTFTLHGDFTLAMGTQKPTFEAKFHEESRELNLVIHNPDDEFGGFEILLGVGSPVPENQWKSVVNLTAGERECQVGGLTPSVTYSITVCGLVLPGVCSDLADPLVFTVLNPELTVPQDVELEAIDSNTVLMLWDSPTDPHGYVAGYVIEWSLDSIWQGSVNLSFNDAHVFTELTPQQNLSATISARIRLENVANFEYIGSRSAVHSVITPPGLDYTVPRNVELHAADCHTMNMTWDPPARPNLLVTGYTIEWSVDNKKQRCIHLSSGHSHSFTDLKPQASVSASVCAHYQPDKSTDSEYTGSFCKLVTASTPSIKRVTVTTPRVATYEESGFVNGGLPSPSVTSEFEKFASVS